MRTAVVVVMVILLAVAGGLQLASPAGRIQAQGTPAVEESAESLLALCPCQPSDLERFNTFMYPSGRPMTPAPDPGWTDEEREAEIELLLEIRLATRGAEVRDRALEVFADARTLMDVRLAAGLAMLVGTSGEPAIDVILAAEWDEIGFGTLTRPEWTVGLDQSDEWDIVFAQSSQHEDFIWFAPIMLDEALHAVRGDGAGRAEEAASRLLQRIVLAELLGEYPEIAAQKTSFSRSQLTFVLGLLYNSTSVFEARGETLYPGGDLNTASVWEDSQVTQYADIPTGAPPFLEEMLTSLGVDASTAPDMNGDGTPDFTIELLELLTIAPMVDAPESPLTGDAMRAIGQGPLTIEFSGAATGATPEAVPPGTPEGTVPAGLTETLEEVVLPTATTTASQPTTVAPQPTTIVPRPPIVVPPTSAPPRPPTAVPPPPPTATDPPPPPTATDPPPPPPPTATDPPPPPEPTATTPPVSTDPIDLIETVVPGLPDLGL